MKLEDFTVIVPTKNEARNILTLLNSIPDCVQVIAVDASSDETADLLLGRRGQERTSVIHSQARIAEARNLGGQAAATPWLVFTDADVSFGPDYFQRLHELCETRPGEAFYGIKLAADDQAGYYQRFSDWQARFDRIGIPAVSGSNLAMRRDAFLRLGGFDPALLVNEDTELGYRIKKSGYAITFAPGLSVFARDHRRLKQGKLRKDLHTLMRCALIYLEVMPGLWKGRDWGYWPKQ